jgi:DNA primase
MSKDITTWIKETLYPSLYPHIDRALPELEFITKGSKWISPLKLDGSSPKDKSKKDKTVVTAGAPGRVLENGGDSLSLVDYVISRDNLEFIQAVKKLAEVAGVKLPEMDNWEGYQQSNKEAILEYCNSYFMYCLQSSDSSRAQELRDYLAGRGYSPELVNDMELGYIPSQDQLYKYLIEIKQCDSALVEETVKLIKTIGESHILTIPYRSGGSLRGFKFRAIGAASPKYVNSTGLDKSGGFFNLSSIRGDKDIVIVEGELDSLSATARGVENVVATGGNSISPDQVRDAIKRGAQKFSICFDYEPGKEKETAIKIKAAIKVILGEGVNRVYIVTLPNSEGAKVDPDSLIRESGVEAFKKAIAEAQPYYNYLLQDTLLRYGEKEDENGNLPEKDIDNMLEEIVQTATALPPLDRDRYKKIFIGLEAIKDLGITEEAYSATVEALSFKEEQAKQDKELTKLISKAEALRKSGKPDKALDLLESEVKEVRLNTQTADFEKLLSPTSEAQIREEDKDLPDSLDTGYKIDGEALLLPGGAISVIAAPTNHGKTVMLINMALNAAQKNPDKRFVFFTYEERANSIIQYFLNAFVDKDLNNQEGSNRRLIKDYFKTGSTQYIRKEAKGYFLSKKAEFFKTYIETGRILVKYVEYNSQELTTAIRYLHRQGNIGGVFIDYFQLLRLPQDSYKGYSSRQEELKQICISLKDVAVDTGLPIIAAAQFNREVTNLLRLHPTKISEAGDIERIVNTLIGLWNIDKKTVLKGITEGEAQEINQIKQSKGNPDTGMYVEILKSRELPTGAYEILPFNGNTGRIAQEIPSVRKGIFD